MQRVLLVLLCFAGMSRADEAKPVPFDVHLADGTNVSGMVEKINDDWSISVAGVKEPVGKGNTLISMRRKDRPLPPPPAREHLLFTNGDMLPCRILDLSKERLRFEFATEPAGERNRQELNAGIADLATLWFTAPDGVENAERFRLQLPREKRRRDRIYFRNGDKIEGVLTSVEQKTVSFEVEKKAVRFDRERIAVIALSTEFARALRPRKVCGRLVLANGCRLTLASLQGAGESWTGKTITGTTVQIPVDQIVALNLLQGRAVYLSDLKPRNYQHIPYLGVRWEYELDAAVSGEPLLLAGNSYDKGIGMHTESRLTFALSGEYEWFETLAGIDDRAAPLGSAFVEVLVDGKSVAPGSESELTSSAAPRRLRLSVKGARELILVTRFGRRGDVQGHVDWAEAKLIRSAN
jgi:hypothetical protein